jgi:type II secretory pathway component GspD/PulD (secretin)
MRNGSEAEIRAVNSRSIVGSITPTRVAAEQMYSSTSESVDEGLTLRLRATVSHDGKHVSVHSVPRLSKTLEIRPVSYTPEGSGDRLTVQVPLTEEAFIETLVNVPDGETVLLGVLGAVAEDDDGTTLLVFLTPRIIDREQLQ